ncbi:hypothetical protein GJAV_G00265140 [Gymnothorax javanicus]|nr:hypothetical protein GJAV_G00265140 [Gymnothorax javanicus]
MSRNANWASVCANQVAGEASQNSESHDHWTHHLGEGGLRRCLFICRSIKCIDLHLPPARPTFTHLSDLMGRLGFKQRIALFLAFCLLCCDLIYQQCVIVISLYSLCILKMSI